MTLSTTVTMEEAQAKLPELLANLESGDELIITQNHQPVKRLTVSEPAKQLQPRKPGTLRGTVLYIAPDFDAPLDEFKEYME